RGGGGRLGGPRAPRRRGGGRRGGGRSQPMGVGWTPVGGRCWAPGLDTSVIRRMFHACVAGGIADAEVFAQQPFDCRGAARVAGLHAVDRISRGAALRGARCARRVDALETGLTTSWIGGAADVVLHEQIDRLVVTL